MKIKICLLLKTIKTSLKEIMIPLMAPHFYLLGYLSEINFGVRRKQRRAENEAPIPRLFCGAFDIDNFFLIVKTILAAPKLNVSWDIHIYILQ